MVPNGLMICGKVVTVVIPSEHIVLLISDCWCCPYILYMLISDYLNHPTV